jgi:hypothetical protein
MHEEIQQTDIGNLVVVAVDKPGNLQRIETRKNASSRYFRPLNGMSSEAGARMLRRRILNPLFQNSSDRVPTGHIQEQNERLSRRDTAMATRKITTAAGWT